jgi:putative exporter of polyketide antibiotics
MPTALVTLGIGALVLSAAPRAAVGTVYGVVTWSMLVILFSSLVSSMQSLDRLSLFHYMALAPAEQPVPGTLAITATAGVLLCAAAMLLADRRDLRRT